MSAQTLRPLIFASNAEQVTDGDGVKIFRNVAHGAMQRFDPFLMLDELASDDAADYIGGFPEHPHRGFETVTYMLEGTMLHRDHMGNEGLLVSGGVQWMTAGRGVIHSEMPQQESGRFHGFQLWINLPAKEKMSEANYREYGPEQIPTVHIGHASEIKVIAGELVTNEKTVTGPITAVSTQPVFFDIALQAGDLFSLPIENSKKVIVYVFEGETLVHDDKDGKPLKAKQLGMLGAGDTVQFSAKQRARLLLLAAVPLNEPVANWGPFVMNTREEVEQAIADYRNGTLV